MPNFFEFIELGLRRAPGSLARESTYMKLIKHLTLQRYT